MWIQHHTRIVWIDDETDEGAGYEEKIEVPQHHLEKESAETFAGLVGHELRQAWRWDVIEGRTQAPGGISQRTILKRAYECYDAGDRFRYANSELEIDARDRAAYVMRGSARYREDVTAHAARVSMMALASGPVGVL
jgi:hypothetical protein